MLLSHKIHKIFSEIKMLLRPVMLKAESDVIGKLKHFSFLYIFRTTKNNTKR